MIPVSDQMTLLVNFWYAHLVGYAIKALRIRLGYHRAGPTVRVSLVLNSATPTELADLCPFVSTTYRVTHPFFDAANCPAVPLEHVPRDWDWVVDDDRRAEPAQLAAFGGSARYHTAADSHLRARLGRGLTGTPPPAYLPHQRLTLDLPADARVRAEPTAGRRIGTDRGAARRRQDTGGLPVGHVLGTGAAGAGRPTPPAPWSAWSASFAGTGAPPPVTARPVRLAAPSRAAGGGRAGRTDRRPTRRGDRV